MQYEVSEEQVKSSFENYSLSNNNEDLIFDVTPFVASLVDSLECSFYTENNSLIITDLNETNLFELMYRLSQCNLLPSKIDCLGVESYSLLLTENVMRDLHDVSEEDSSVSVKLLKEMVKMFSGINCSISLHPNELHITNVSLNSMDSIAKTLKILNVKPKRVFSDSNSFYSFELAKEDIFAQQSTDESLTQMTNNSDYFTILRSLRDGLVQSPDNPTTDATNIETLLSTSTNNDNGVSFHSLQNLSFNSGTGNRTRGRPRKFPAVEDKPKRKRGRPRISDMNSYLSNTQTIEKVTDNSPSVDDPAFDQDNME